MLQMLERIDFNILIFIHNTTPNIIFDKVMLCITLLGNMGMVWIIISILLVLNRKYRYVGIMCMASLILAAILGEGILKNIIQRPRPFSQVPAVSILITKPMSYSFPSGHTASSFAVAGIISNTLRKYKIYAILLATLIAFSRLYLFVHYPSDILAGILLGVMCSRIVLKVYGNRYVSMK